MDEPRKSKWWIWVVVVGLVAVGVWLLANWADFSAGFAAGFSRETGTKP